MSTSFPPLHNPPPFFPKNLGAQITPKLLLIMFILSSLHCQPHHPLLWSLEMLPIIYQYPLAFLLFLLCLLPWNPITQHRHAHLVACYGCWLFLASRKNWKLENSYFHILNHLQNPGTLSLIKPFMYFMHVTFPIFKIKLLVEAN